MPADFNGKYAAMLSVPLGPYSVSQDQEWFTVEPRHLDISKYSKFKVK